MDGLLLDTRTVIAQTIGEVVRDLELPLEAELAAPLALLSEAEIAQKLRDMYGPSFSRTRFREHFEFNLEQKLQHDIMLKAGVFDFLVLLHRRKIPSIVVASCRTVAAQTRLSNAKILRYVQGVLGCETVRKHKPAPDILLAAAREMGSRPSDCLAVDCDEAGIRAAHEAGMIPILIPDNFDPSDEVRGLARQICTSLRELSKILQAHI